MSPGGRRLWIVALLAALTLTVFWSARGFEFVSYDDPTYVSGNERVMDGLTGDNVLWAFTTDYFSNWHPLTWLSLMLDAAIHGNDPRGFHSTAIWIHLFNALLLFLLLERTTGKSWPSAFVAALFAVHPLHVEAVAWISSRKDVLSTFFGLLALLAYADYAASRRRSRYALALVAFALSLLSKQMLVTLPFLLLLLDIWPLGRVEWTGWREGSRALVRLVPEKIPFFVLTVIFSVAVYLAQQSGGAVRDMQEFPLLARLYNAIVVYVLYFWKTLVPTGLACYYPYPASIAAWKVLAAGSFLIGVTAAAVMQLRRRPYLAVGWLWYVGTLVPVIGLVQIGEQQMADRYTYVPLVGLFVAITWLTLSLVPEGVRGSRATLPVAAAIVVVALAATARAQTLHWRDSLSLYRHAVAVTAGNTVAHNNLGTAYGQAGRLAQAMEQFQAALEIDPDYADAHNNLGNALLQQGRTDEAGGHFREALRLDPDLVAARMNYGVVLERSGRLAEAVGQFDRAIELNPELGEVRRYAAAAHDRWGTALWEGGERDAAIAQFREALRLDPDLGAAREHLRMATLKPASPL